MDKLKQAIRARREQTGERHSIARMHVLRTQPERWVTKARLRKLMETFPELTIHGLRWPREWKRKPDSAARLCEGREALIQRLDQVKVCTMWICSECVPGGGEPHRIHSYSAKHFVERAYRSADHHPVSLPQNYVSNGAFIAAAALLGYSPDPDGVLNAFFALRLKHFREKRPPATGFSAWLFAQRERDEPIGDLAQDAYRDEGWPEHLSDEELVLMYSGDALPYETSRAFFRTSRRYIRADDAWVLEAIEGYNPEMWRQLMRLREWSENVADPYDPFPPEHLPPLVVQAIRRLRLPGLPAQPG